MRSLRRSFSFRELFPLVAIATALGAGAAAGCSDSTTGGAGGAGGEAGGGSPSSSTHATTHTSTHSSAHSTGATGGGGAGGEGGTGGTGGGVCDPTELPIDPNGVPPTKLSESGLYDASGTFALAPYILAYEPRYKLWSDGAEKERYAYIPSGCQIDNTDPDAWEFPVGTRFWKQFSDPGTGKHLETRLIERFGPGDNDWSFNVYGWNDAQTEATLIPDMTEHDDWLGTQHDIPAAPGACKTCHNVLGDRSVLGFDGILLNGSVPLKVTDLNAKGLLKVPNTTGYTIPGTPVEQDAIGYLHANCAQCHNPKVQIASDSLFMRLRTTDTTVAMTNVYMTAVKVPTAHYQGHIGQGGGDPNIPISTRVQPQAPDESCVWFRMSRRSPIANQTTQDQMPPLATEMVDQAGLDAIAAWINQLPP